MAVMLLAVLLAACSPKRLAVDLVGSALAGGSDSYATDGDPDLVKEALPFGLKTIESLLAVSPDNRDLLLAAAQGFTGYAYLLQEEAQRTAGKDLVGARELRQRAHGLYLRGRAYALRGLETRHANFTARLATDLEAALAATDKTDVAFLYWAGAGWAGALGADKQDLRLVAELPSAAALIGRVLELDESYDSGAAHEFFIAYEGGRPGGSAEQARRHYERALALSGGLRGSVHLSLAEAVALPAQDLAEFRSLIAAALAVDPDAVAELRLINSLAQRRAAWLENQIPDLFVTTEDINEEPLS
jgi:predicted anti-sigma-YlaC factor YlaD